MTRPALVVFVSLMLASAFAQDTELPACAVAGAETPAAIAVVSFGNAIGVDQVVDTTDPILYLEEMQTRGIIAPFTRYSMQVLLESDPTAYLADLLASGAITEEEHDRLEVILAASQLYGPGAVPVDVFVIFLADVLNGTEPPPATAEAAQAELAEAGIVVSLEMGALTDENICDTVSGVLSQPDFANALADTYQTPASPINDSGN